MNKWVLLYCALAPLFGIVMFFWFNRRFWVTKWWLWRHPQTVYRVKFFFPNKMYQEFFISTLKDSFEFKNGTYNIKKEAIIRKAWKGVFASAKVSLNDSNTIDFRQYRVFHEGGLDDLPNTAQLIGELHYVFDCPDPIIYADASVLLKEAFLRMNKWVLLYCVVEALLG